MRTLITGPSLADAGGVAAYYSAVLPHLPGILPDVYYLEVGSTRHRGGALHPLVDQLRFRSTLRRLRPDLVLCNPSLDLKSFLRDGVFVLQAALFGTPALVFFRGWDKDFERQVERSWRWFFNLTYRRVRAFIVLAADFRAKLVDWGVAAPVHLGTTVVAEDLIKDFSIEQKWSQHRPDAAVRLLFLARLELAKGIREALGALLLLRAKGLPVTLTVAGDGGAMATVREFAAAHPELSGALSILGDVRGEPKRELLASHDIYCFPSYTEGMPNSVLEAMAFGLPVITSAVGGLVDIFEDEKMGCLLKKVTAQDVAAAAEKLVGDAGLRRTISEFNHRFALENFLALPAATRLTSIINEVTKAVHARPQRTLITGPSLADAGGVATYYNAVLPHLRRMLPEVHYLDIGRTRRYGGRLHPLIDQLRLFKTLWRLRPTAVVCNPSLDLKSFLRDGVFVLQAALFGTPALVFFHGWDKDFERQVERSWRWFFNLTYRRARAFIVLAADFRAKLVDWGVAAPVHLGTTVVAEDLIKDFSIEQKWSQHRPDAAVRLLFLARLELAKGIREALGALLLLRAKGLPVTLTVAGDGGAMATVREFAAAHPELSGALSILGDVRGEPKRELLASHDIYCFPSYTEGMPNSVLEAMAFGLPVITSAVGGLVDIFEDEKMGCLLKKVTAQDVAAAAEKLVGDAGLRRTISEFNHRFALENFLALPAATRLADRLLSIASLASLL